MQKGENTNQVRFHFSALFQACGQFWVQVDFWTAQSGAVSQSGGALMQNGEISHWSLTLWQPRLACMQQSGGVWVRLWCQRHFLDERVLLIFNLVTERRRSYVGESCNTSVCLPFCDHRSHLWSWNCRDECQSRLGMEKWPPSEVGQRAKDFHFFWSDEKSLT